MKFISYNFCMTTKTLSKRFNLLPIIPINPLMQARCTLRSSVFCLLLNKTSSNPYLILFNFSQL